MKKTKSTVAAYKRHKIKLIALIVLIAMLLTVMFTFVFLKERAVLPNDSDNRPVVQNVISIEGTVTLVKSSCGAESLDPQEDVRRHSICDSGKALRIDNKTIYTSSGGPGRGYSVDVTDINLGDRVQIKYVNDATYGPSLNCSECSARIVD